MSRDHYQSMRHWICFDCRRSIKTYNVREQACPECAGAMYNMGYWFRPPRREAVNQWRKIALLVQAGLLFPTCNCNGCRLKVAVKTLADGKRVAAEMRSERDRREQSIGRSIEYKRAILGNSYLRVYR